MTIDHPGGPLPESSTDLEVLLGRYGIERIRADSFAVNGFRYTNALDAIAEAKRHPPRLVAASSEDKSPHIAT